MISYESNTCNSWDGSFSKKKKNSWDGSNHEVDDDYGELQYFEILILIDFVVSHVIDCYFVILKYFN